MKPEIERFEGPEALARAVAAEWLGLLERSRGGRFTVGLSGGRIAGKFFEVVRQMAGERGGLPPGLEFFWADERCVGPEDPESNYALANGLMLKPLGVAEGRIHRIRGEMEPEAAAKLAAKELSRQASREAEGRVEMDLVLLGMGEDGHVASLFPGETEEAMRDPALYRFVLGPKPPPERITMGYGTIAAAREVWVMVSGAGKGSCLEKSVSGEAQTPLARVLRMRSRTRVFTDV